MMTAKLAIGDSFLEIDDESVIELCSKCGHSIGLHSPMADAPASPWLCRRCGSCYFARCLNSNGEATAGVRPISYYEVMKAIYVYMDGDSCPVLRESERAKQCTPARKFAGRDLRKQKRYPCPAQVTIVPLGHDYRIAAQPARVMTTNLSAGGAALVHSKSIVAPFLAIDFSASGIDLLPAILQVTRVRPRAPGYEIAGKFMSRILH